MKKKKYFKNLLFLAAISSLLIFQIVSTNIKQAYTYTPHEINLQIQRMNSFPPSLARLGYILNVKKEVQIFEKIINNFFFTVDFKEYFPRYFPSILFPFFILGFYIFADERNKHKLVFYSFLISIIVLSLIGPFAKFGPILLIFYFIYFIILGFLRMVRLIKK